MLLNRHTLSYLKVADVLIIVYLKIYEWGERKKKFKQEDETFEVEEYNENPYMNVESKLAKYIRPRHRHHRSTVDNLNQKRSKTALNLHKFTSSPYVNYGCKSAQPNEASLKLSSNLENLIRDEIRKNNGKR